MQSCDCQLTQECDIQKLESFRREGFSEEGSSKGGLRQTGSSKEGYKGAG